ncbi:MAG: hypothetical protein B7Z14_14950 [Bosea sp. 32-68-6]|nr:MAG: hypothetical protein B7Z14_14950 [Bosea sp. 32-68-6]
MNTGDNPSLTPPKWMKKSEKETFNRLILARSVAGRPVQSIEFDAVCDFVAVRSRLDKLRRMEREASFPAERLATMRAIETATATARKLGRDLHLDTNRA